MNLGPKNKREEVIFAVEGLRVDVQHAIHKAMKRANVSQKELARRLGVSEARVSQIFAPQCNVTLTLLARIFHALDQTCVIMGSKDLDEGEKAMKKVAEELLEAKAVPAPSRAHLEGGVDLTRRLARQPVPSKYTVPSAADGEDAEAEWAA